jgi:hypothetical protein
MHTTGAIIIRHSNARDALNETFEERSLQERIVRFSAKQKSENKNGTRGCPCPDNLVIGLGFMLLTVYLLSVTACPDG